MSTIKVDTLQTRSGSTAAVTGAGFVATDQIRGNTAANSVTVVAEGGTVTTNLQQGLAKAWATLTGTSTISLDDSLNVASISDEGTGDYETTYTSAFSSATKSTVASGGYWGCNVEIDGAGTAATSIFICKDIGDESQRDPEVLNTSVHGDLA